MIYGITEGTDFEKFCDGAAKAETAGLMTYYALARMAKEQGYPDEVSETFINMANQEACMLGSMFPGNINQYVNHISAFGLDTDQARLIRLFFQPVLIFLALWSTGGWQQQKEWWKCIKK